MLKYKTEEKSIVCTLDDSLKREELLHKRRYVYVIDWFGLPSGEDRWEKFLHIFECLMNRLFSVFKQITNSLKNDDGTNKSSAHVG